MLFRTKLIAAGLFSFFLLSCQEDEEVVTPIAQQPVIQFGQTQLQTKESDGEQVITLNFSKPTVRAGSITLVTSATETSKFMTEPQATNNKIIIPFVVGTTSASFKTIPINNNLMDGNKTMTFTLSEVSGDVALGTNRIFVFTSLDDESRVEVNFNNDQGNLLENSSEGSIVKLKLSNVAPANGTVEVDFYTNNLIYGQDFTTQPAANGATLQLPLVVGQDYVEFKVIPVNDARINGERSIQFNLVSANGGAIKGNQVTHTMKMVDDEISNFTRGWRSGAGLWTVSQYFAFNPDGTIAKIAWDQYTPGYLGGSYTYEYVNGKLHKMVENANRETYYLWEGNRIVRSEIYRNGEMIQYNLYGYDQAGNVGENLVYYLQPDGEMKLGTIWVYLYYTDGNLYKQLQYSPNSDPEGEHYLVATQTYSGYMTNTTHPFPLEFLPNKKAQLNLPTYYVLERDGQRYVHTLSYSFDAQGRPTRRTVTGASSESTAYEYFD